MKIKEIEWQHRNDFQAVYECEFCSHSYTNWGYDDANFHENVVPSFECPKCGKSSNDTNEESEKE